MLFFQLRRKQACRVCIHAHHTNTEFDGELTLFKNFIIENNYMRKGLKKTLPKHEQNPLSKRQLIVFIQKS